MTLLESFVILEACTLTFVRHSATEPVLVQSFQPPFPNRLCPGQVSIISKLIINAMECINMDLTVHWVNDPKQSLLVDQQWEVSYPILSYSNLQNLPVFFLSNPEELTLRFCVWESGLPLCIVPQVFHFPELVVWCAQHFATDSNSIVTEQLSQILITISIESIIKMLGLHTT